MEHKPQPETQSKLSSLPNGAVKKRHHPPATILHRECLKNHAANLGGHALDGCCEFMPSPAATLADPTSLKCAACSCHRNFHRRVSISSSSEEIECFTSAPHALLALSRNERPSAARKRFRSKFSAEQKGKMLELSERLGWRLQKRDEGLVEEYCRDIGVDKGVFKVWMHNNKYQLLRVLRGGEGRSDVAGDGGGGGGRIVEGNVMNGSFSSS